VTRVAGRELATVAVVVTLAALAIALAPSDLRPAVSRLAILAIGILPAWWLVRRFLVATRSTPERFESELRPPVAIAVDIPGLRSVDHTMRMALGSSFGVEFMLRPRLRELASWRLLRNRGIDLEATPELARQLVDEPLWSLIQAGEPVRNYSAPGISLADIRTSLEQLERI
jgi:hypothetical protein